MTPKTFTALAAAAVATLVLAALVNASSDDWASGVPKGAKLLPGLAQGIAGAGKLTVRQGEKSLTLERKSPTEWVAAAQGGYPVQSEKVRALLARLVDAEVVAAKTRMPDRFKLLDLDDVGKDAKSRLITLAGAKGVVLAELIVGKRSVEQFGAGKGGTYVRRAGQNETWLINSEIDVSPDVNQWVDTTIFEVDIKSVMHVTIDQSGKPRVRIDRQPGAPSNKDGYRLADMPAGKVLKTDYALEDVINAFARVEFEDVRRRPPDAAASAAGKTGTAPGSTAAGTGVSTAIFEGEDGLLVTIAVRGEGDNRWTRIEAEGTGASEPVAARINGRAGEWEYKLPSWKHDQLFKARDELLKDPAPAGDGAARK